MIFLAQSKQISRKEAVSLLIERDGDFCYICGLAFEANDIRTLDHYVPQSFGKANGWTYEEINDINNLKLSSQKCNARKGSILPNADGSLPDLTPRLRPAQRRAIRKDRRQEVCNVCQSGRLLGPSETCATCGSMAQPIKFPAWGKVKTSECIHSGPWSCWACMIGIVERQPAIVDVLDGEGSLDGEVSA